MVMVEEQRDRLMIFNLLLPLWNLTPYPFIARGAGKGSVQDSERARDKDRTTTSALENGNMHSYKLCSVPKLSCSEKEIWVGKNMTKYM